MANYVVTTLDDESFEGTETTGAPDGNGLSLREALGLALANGAGTPDTITFDASLAGDTLTLTGGELGIGSDVTIDGDVNGDDAADITIDAAGASRVFGIYAGASTLDALTITGGDAGSSKGGGIRVITGAQLTVANSTISGNSADVGGGVHVAVGALTLINTTVAGNSAQFGGGGISNGGTGTATLTNVTLSGNSASLAGGGIYNFGTATLTNTTLSGNSAAHDGGGLSNYGSATLANTIVAGNHAGDSGDDVRSIFGFGTPTYSGGNIVGDTLSQGGVTQQTGIGLTDIFASVGADPHTGVTSGLLADNGGAVETIAIVQGGAAQNTGDDSFLSEATAGVDLNGDGDTNDTIATDARGDARVAIGHSDIGAYEIQTLTVTTLADSGDDLTITGDIALDAADGGGLSLREALLFADAAAGADTILFDAAITGGSNPGVDDGVIMLGGTQLVIASSVTIEGDVNGDGEADITIDAAGGSRVFNVTGGTSTLDGLTMTGGKAYNGSGVFVGFAAHLTIANSTLSNNGYSNGYGGGVYNKGAVTLTNSTLSGNQALDGGAIQNFGIATLIDTTLSGNTAGYGAGLYNAGTATLTNTTLSGNSSTYDGGGVFNLDGSAVTLVNTTLSGNSATQHGGGLYNHGNATLANTIIAGNQAGVSGDDVHTYIGSTTTYSGGNIVGDTLSQGGITQQSGIALTDIFAAVGADPHTGVTSGLLADNGGAVETIALNRDVANPAIDTGDATLLDETVAGIDLNGDGDTTDVIATDARGLARDVDFDGANGAAPDLGAFEAQADSSLVVTTLDDSGANLTVTGDLAAETADGGGLSLREALILANNNFDGDSTNATDITFDASLAGGTLTLSGGELGIASDVTIDGDTNGDNVADITIDAHHASRVFNVTGGTSTLDGLTITGGYLSGIGSGGGVHIGGSATLTIVNSTVSGNSAYYGGGIANNATTTLTNVTLSGNSSATSGGGIYNSDTATATLTNVTLSGNSAGWNGGGIANSGTATLTNTTLSGNVAVTVGGGIVSNSDGTTTLSSSIVAGNHDGLSGDDIYTFGTGTAYSGANIVGDTLSQNGVSEQPGIALTDIFASVSADPHTGVTSGLLADNGGPVETIALSRDLANPALDAGNATLLDETVVGIDLNGDGDTLDVIATDARGFARSVDFHAAAAPDLGAFEAQPDDGFVVTTLDDSGDNLTVTGSLADEIADGGGLSLREALILANADPTNAASITFDASLAGGTATLAGGELVIASDVTIDGDINGDDKADITIDAAGGSRVFDVTAGTSTLGALTITGGDAGTGNSGGGVYVAAAADLTIANSTLSGNSADHAGGGVANHGTAMLVNTTLSGNSAIYGGGLYNADTGIVTLTSATLSANGANYGGGIYNHGTATLVNATLSGNSSINGGGGLFDANTATATLTNTTLSGNSAEYGGGLYNAHAATVTLTNATLSGNSANYGGGLYNHGTATLANSIVAGNIAVNGPDDDIRTGGASTTTYSGVNLFSQVGAGDAQDIVETNLANIFASVGADPSTGVNSGLLADNGGPVETILILRGGPAQNAGDNSALPPDTLDLNNNGDLVEPLPYDARGENRIANGTVDVGAVELQNAAPTAQDDTFATDEATNVNDDVTADNGHGADSDPDSDTLTVTMVDGAAINSGDTVSLASGALLTMNSDGTFTYDSNDAFDFLPVGVVGHDSFTYTVDDGNGGTDTATVTVDITGLDTNDTFIGTPGRDVFFGGVGNDTMKGLGGKDKLKGGTGKDVLDGGKGNDKLTGNSGNDSFIFDTKLNKHSNVDKITDFTVNHDTIWLDATIFGAVGSKLSKSEFHIGAKAHDGNDRIIYDDKTGELFYDKNGDKKGGDTLFAKLDKHLHLDHNDFVVHDFVM